MYTLELFLNGTRFMTLSCASVQDANMFARGFLGANSKGKLCRLTFPNGHAVEFRCKLPF